MKRKSKIILSIIIQLIVFSIFGQDQVLYNYANLNSTNISAEFLDSDMILETVDNNYGWEGSWSENNWYYFEFNQEIQIDQLELYFYNNTCLKDCKLEYQVITNDTVVEVIIDKLSSKHKLDIKSNYIIIKRKDVAPSGPGHINEIGIISKTKPLSQECGNPSIKINKTKRLKIKYSIEGLAQKEINEQYKIWRARKKFYNRYVKKQIEPYVKEFFETRIFYGNDDNWYCYKVNGFTNILSNKNLIDLFDNCDCNIRELFFERKMKPTHKMKSKGFNFLGNEISYNSDSTEQILVKYLEGGNAWAGHAIPHICLMGKEKYINKIDSLQNDSNVFTQVQAIKGLIYFDKPKNALEIAKKIYEKEIQSLVNDTISMYGYYVCVALCIMNEYYPNETLPLMLDLYKKYRTLYPDDKSIYNHCTFAFDYGTISGRKIQSIQGCDQSILFYIEEYLNRFPHLSKNPVIKEFEENINEKQSLTNEMRLD